MKYIKYLLLLVVGIFLSTPVMALSTNTLSTLSLSNGQLSPTFSAQVTSYTATINAADTIISAASPDNTVVITGIGKTSLNYGLNQVTVMVSGGSGQNNSYVINITRPDNRDANNNLKSLTVSTSNLSFNSATTIYNVTVDQSVSSATVTAAIEDSTASFVDGYGSPKTIDNLNFGNNEIQIKVSAENGTIKTYTVNINRNDGRSTNSYLSSLSISHGMILFDRETLGYSVKVPYSVSSLDVTATTEDEKATVSSIGGKNLSVGKNTITVTVTAENGSVRPYTITIYRQAEGSTLSNNNYLSSLKIGNYSVKLVKKTSDYNLLVDTDQPLEISFSSEDPEAIVEVSNSDNIVPGSTVVINVTAQDGSQRKYSITIKKKISIIILIASLLIIAVSFTTAFILFILRVKNIIAAKKSVPEANITDQTSILEPPKITHDEPKGNISSN